MAMSNGRSLDRVARRSGTRIAGAGLTWVCAWSVVLGVDARSSMAEGGKDIVATLGYGNGPGQLAFQHGDTEDEFGVLTSVDENGNACLSDAVNGRMLVLGRDGSQLFSVEQRPGSRHTPNDILALGGGRFVVAFRALEPPALLRVYDSRGAVLVEKASESAGIKMRLPNGNFLMYLRQGYGEYDEMLQQVERHDSVAPLVPSVRAVASHEVLKWNNQCWLAPAALIANAESARIVGDTIRYIGLGVFVDIAADGTVTSWRYPESTYTRPIPPPGTVNPGLWIDTRKRVIWQQVSLKVGLDGNFYGFAYTPDHYELIRWNLDELPKQTFPPVQNQPPVITFEGPTTVKAGAKYTLWVEGKDPERAGAQISSGALPPGATLQVNRQFGEAALVWAPTAGQVGQHTVVFNAEDGMCGKATKSVTITVER